MGTWGAALYDDDNAADMRDSLALLCKVPKSGDRLLEILKGIYGECDAMDDEDVLFWLVTADQFERRGIECREVAATALSVIESGADLTFARESGADERYLKIRAAVLEELAKRLKSPRPFKTRIAPKNPPPMVLATGEVYAFPTQDGQRCSIYYPEKAAAFRPNGWGALVVLDSGRAFDWLPWVALAGLTIRPGRKPTLKDALGARLIFHCQTQGAGRFVPKPVHAKTLRLELVGRVVLDADKVQPVLSTWSLEMAISYNWPIAGGTLTAKTGESDPKRGCVLSTLVKEIDSSCDEEPETKAKKKVR